jgi:hypothetical protein
MTLMEGSFGQASQNHHFKRARWRRLWRQRIQDHLIAAVQNVKKIIKYGSPMLESAAKRFPPAPESTYQGCFDLSRVLGVLKNAIRRHLSDTMSCSS